VVLEHEVGSRSRIIVRPSDPEHPDDRQVVRHGRVELPGRPGDVPDVQHDGVPDQLAERGDVVDDEVVVRP
jgi:hypothetical protein